MPAGSDRLEDRILDFLRNELKVREPGLGPEVALLSTGLIDSVDLARIAAFVEGETGLEIPDADITVAHFDSIARMLEYVQERRAAQVRR